MKALQILSQIEMTGAEAHAVTLSEWLAANGCEVLIISNKLHIPTKIPFLSREIHTNSRFVRWKNIFFIRNLVKERGFKVIHCHSRAAVRVAYWATLGLPVVLISTIHGRQHVSFSKKIFDIYGDVVIGVCENVHVSMLKDFKIAKHKLFIIGNPVKFSDHKVSLSNPLAKSRIAIIARGTGPKGQRTKDLITNTFPTLLETFPDLSIDVIGGLAESIDSETNQNIYKMNQKYPGRFNICGFITNMQDRLQEYKLILGAGRIPIESLSRGIPCYCIGEYSCEGLITPANYESSKKSNFGDIGATKVETSFDYEQITSELVAILKGNPLTNEQRLLLQQKMHGDFSSDKVCSDIKEMYRFSLKNKGLLSEDL